MVLTQLAFLKWLLISAHETYRIYGDEGSLVLFRDARRIYQFVFMLAVQRRELNVV